MKQKLMILGLMLIFICSGLFSAQKATGKKYPDREVVTKTYFLKHISPLRIRTALKAYFYNSSSDRDSRMISVVMQKKYVREFEALMKKLDVPKKSISFRIFTVIASKKGKGYNIKNKDLSKVIHELKKILSFDSFTLDGDSYISTKEGSRGVRMVLSSNNFNLHLNLHDISIKGGEKGKRSIEVDTLSLTQEKPRADLLRTSIAINENGYLVAGVSKIGENGESLVLIINAEIK